ncbi:calpain-C isoform X2 [Galleria mellonella]|uniref:Calpain-C isoform X2 n=1 Tax=Galleria mellonella TaxID=7137 RepID=A0A6J3C486_GALME|nr:calpain-C isoform X2 [Galleria mellonella]
MSYEIIKATCSNKNELWEDPEFPAETNSIFYFQRPAFHFVWKRPMEIFPKPSFISSEKGVSFDIVSGKLGDKWLVSCVSMLYLAKGLFQKVVPVDQQFDTDYSGIFRFNIWWCGQWREVLVDDKLPTINGRLVFLQSMQTPQVWPALLEKAYAKLHGSYEALKYGNLLDGLAHLTGGITESLSDVNDVSTLEEILKGSSLVTAVYLPEARCPSKPALQPEMNYRIYRVEKVHGVDGPHHLVLINRPLKSGSTKILHLVDSTVWKGIPSYERERLLSDTRGMWMLFKDFKQVFTQLEIVHFDAETARLESSLTEKEAWHVEMYQGSWRRGVTAGGCRNNGSFLSDFFHMNPQIQLILMESATVIVALNQHSIMEPKVIGFSIYKIPTYLTEPASQSFFKGIKSTINSQYTNSRQVSHRCELEAGTYIVVPTTYVPREEAEFSLRVFSNGLLDMMVLDYEPQMTKPIWNCPLPGLETTGFVQYEPLFLQLADEHKTIDVYALQELLEACLPNDYIKSCATLDTCRQIVLSIDNCTGRLSLAQFRDFIFSLRDWQTVFRTHTKEKMGVLRVERLRDALHEVGFVVPEQILALLVLRYMRKDGMLRFGDFVSAVMHLHRAFRLFYSNDETSYKGKMKLDLSEWLKYTFMC